MPSRSILSNSLHRSSITNFPLLIFSSVSRPLACLFLQQTRSYVAVNKKSPQNKKTKQTRTHFQPSDVSQIDQFALVDAIRYIRAMEVGQNLVQTKYEIHVKLRTGKSGPTIKSRIRLPKPVKTDMRICVIAEGKQADAAKKAGAVIAGTDEVFDKIRNSELDFDKCICHDRSLQTLTKAKLGSILGPKGLMPSQKLGTVVPDITAAIRDLTGSSDYRERQGVIRFPIGQLAFTENQVQKNIKAFMEQLKTEFGALSYKADKSIDEVVISSTRSAGFSLSGELKTSQNVETPEPGVSLNKLRV